MEKTSINSIIYISQGVGLAQGKYTMVIMVVYFGKSLLNANLEARNSGFTWRMDLKKADRPPSGDFDGRSYTATFRGGR
jgi:hypothetical protein